MVLRQGDRSSAATMEPTNIIPQLPSLGPNKLPFRPTLPPVPQLTIDKLDGALERKRSIGSFNDPYVTSPGSFSSPSTSFSQDSFTEAGSVSSTRFSTPLSPASTHTCHEDAKDADEFSRSPLGRLSECDKAFLTPKSHGLERYRTGNGLFKRDREEEDAPCKRPRLAEGLPRLNDLIRVAEHGMHRSLSDQTGAQWRTSGAESASAGEYVLSSAPAVCRMRDDDPITRSLNALREERERGHGIPLRDVLSQPPGLGYYYPRRSPPHNQRPPKHTKSDAPHCNVKYRPQERDFIRYMKVDKKKTWAEIKELYKHRFPSADLTRQVQGIQGVHYRENGAVPQINEHSQLEFMEDGHVRSGSLPIRVVKQKWRLGLMWLYPERAVNWDWLTPEDRQIAQDIYEERLPQYERARREAIEAGTWVEKSENCACCLKDDEKATKRVPKRRSNESISAFQGVQALQILREGYRSML